MDDQEPFLARWSRRKLEAKQEAPAAQPQAVAAALPSASAADPNAAGARADAHPEHREFFDPQVDEKLRRAALKKLFSEPQFNVMDGLDTYIDDYSKPDPIPEAMLRQLSQAKELFLIEDEKTASVQDKAAASAAAAAAPAQAASSLDAPEPAAVGPPPEDAAVAAGAPPEADSEND